MILFTNAQQKETYKYIYIYNIYIYIKVPLVKESNRGKLNSNIKTALQK